MEVNCAETCINGCILGTDCPHLEYRQAASKFINERSMDELLDIAAESVRKKFLEGVSSQRLETSLPHWPE